MMKSKRAVRFGGCGAVLSAVCLGLAASATAATGPLWVRQFGTPEPEQSLAVATGPGGNVYLAGVTRGPLGGAYQGDDDAWVAKYDATGRPLWRRQLGTPENNAAFGVATDTAGNVYLTGGTAGSLAGRNQGDFDAWVAKYDRAGHPLWKRQFGTALGEDARGVATDVAGNVYLTGATLGSLAGRNQGDFDAWVAKYDRAGHPLWKRQFGTADADFAFGVATDGTGNVYLSGLTRGPLGGAYHGNDDAWIAKYDAAGHALWRRQLGTPENDAAFGVATDTAGNVYLTGGTAGSLAGRNQGDFDAWVAKYDSAGRPLWKRQFGTALGEEAHGVATDVAGGVYLTGATLGSLGGPGQGNFDAWVAKYNGAGHPLWRRQLGTADADFASGVATDGTGNVYLSGWTFGPLGGPYRGGGDAWAAKYSTQR